MQLFDLLADLPQFELRGPRVEVSGVTADSRHVSPGFLYVAVPGLTTDGHRFVADAISRGAVAVVMERSVGLPDDVAHVQVPNARRALAELAASFYGHPSRKLPLIGITGTNGKTTTAFLIKQLAQACGYLPGVIGTAGQMLGDQLIEAKSGFTTPEPVALQRVLHAMAEGGASFVAMEVSSHALEQRRVEGMDYQVAVFTNLTHEHLDYHKDMESYYQAKARLFKEHLGAGGTAVINIDDSYGRRLVEELPVGVRLITYGSSAEADVRATLIRAATVGSLFHLESPARPGCAPAPTPIHAQRLFGAYNVSNALAAVTVGIALGWPVSTMIAALETILPAPGRFQPVMLGQAFHVIIDYAHTPDGFAQLFSSIANVREPAQRVIAVFGSAGHRDKAKRPEMGRIAGEYSDVVILTEEDPRTESALGICADVQIGITNERCQVEVIEDRVAAIHRAIGLARTGDIVLILGKGHETELEVQHATTWSGDIHTAEHAIRQQLARR